MRFDSSLNDDPMIILQMAQTGDTKAQTILYNQIINLNKSIIKKFRNHGVLYDDLIQESAFIFLKTLEKFNPKKGCAFTTYLYTNVQRHLKDVVATQGSAITLPIYIQDNIIRGSKEGKEHKYKNFRSKFHSLDDPIFSDEKDTYIVNLIVNDGDKFEELERQERIEEILNTALSKLPKPEELSLRKWYGIGCERLTQREIAIEMKCTEPNVERYRKNGIKRLRSRYSRFLREFL